MTMARTAETKVLPLLVWHEQSEIDRLAAQCAVLAERVRRLPPRSFHRIELEFRLRELRARQLKLECRIASGVAS
jgi:hypothetical protein